jgi:ABC-type multidrug transport system fused ATPase/permease subunit
MLTDDRLETPLRLSQLEDFIRELPDGIDTEVGERGTRLSGGQRQRIGIARALFTNPKLLVFDEATSALDGKTEFELTEAISALKGKLTLVTIAHRLSTIRNSDVVLYLDKGKLVAQGTIDQVRAKVPNFDKLAAEMGL